MSIRDWVRRLSETNENFSVCIDCDDDVVGVITEGDFRRAVHAGIQLDETIESLLNKDFVSLGPAARRDEIVKLFNENFFQEIPILHDQKLVDVIKRSDYADYLARQNNGILDLPVVIMAGGKGSRLDPFTRILPKPLIPLGDKAVVEVIMEQFLRHGVDRFIVSLNEKGRMIRAFFHDHNLGGKVSFIEETKPLGTGGALSLLPEIISGQFFVTNCDIIINADYGALVEFHVAGQHDMTLVCSTQQHTIPYGVCYTDRSGRLVDLSEKPTYDYLVNAGLYLLEPSVVPFVPKDTYFDMTDLIKAVLNNGLRVGVFPVSEQSWLDIGQWNKYHETLNKLEDF
jgi:dTDP-glucose pyrophosphorylase